LRDGALPFSNLWVQVNPHFEMLVNAVCLSATVILVRCFRPTTILSNPFFAQYLMFAS